MPGIRRKAPNAYTDEISDSADKLVCSECYEKGLNAVLVPYVMVDGRPDPKFKRCPYCSAIIPRYAQKHVPRAGPLGTPNPSALVESNFVTIKEKRNVRKKGKAALIEKEEVPKLAGKRDIELEYLLTQGVLVNLNDDVIEEE